jgi:ABC-type branched-subunit amino acid transport system substrate-binding protein
MTSDVLSGDFIKALGPAAEGFLYTQTVSPESDALNDLKKRYAKRFNTPLETTQLVAWGFDGIGVIAEAIRRSSTSGRTLRDELADTRDYRGVSDVITISTGGSVTNYPSIYQVREAKLEPISK